MNYDDSERVTTRLSHSRLGMRAEPENIALLEARWQAFLQNNRKPVTETFAQILARQQQETYSHNQPMPKEPKHKQAAPGRQVLAKRVIMFKG